MDQISLDSALSYADNSYHVDTGSNVSTNAVLDGFTIAGGNANGDGVVEREADVADAKPEGEPPDAV